jgi:hypothetical protein
VRCGRGAARRVYYYSHLAATGPNKGSLVASFGECSAWQWREQEGDAGAGGMSIFVESEHNFAFAISAWHQMLLSRCFSAPENNTGPVFSNMHAAVATTTSAQRRSTASRHSTTRRHESTASRHTTTLPSPLLLQSKVNSHHDDTRLPHAEPTAVFPERLLLLRPPRRRSSRRRSKLPDG